MPYVYFSSGGFQNDYHDADAISFSHADKTTGKVAPYYASKPVKRYYKPDSFQLISAGANARFGPGGAWDATVGYALPPGSDDLSNFHEGLLSVPAK
jgi:hypothetical protein